MNQTVPLRVGNGLTKIAATATTILVGTMLAAVLIGWVAFLLWIAGEGVIAVVHWI